MLLFACRFTLEVTITHITLCARLSLFGKIDHISLILSLNESTNINYPSYNIESMMMIMIITWQFRGKIKPWKSDTLTFLKEVDVLSFVLVVIMLLIDLWTNFLKKFLAWCTLKLSKEYLCILICIWGLMRYVYILSIISILALWKGFLLHDRLRKEKI